MFVVQSVFIWPGFDQFDNDCDFISIKNRSHIWVKHRRFDIITERLREGETWEHDQHLGISKQSSILFMAFLVTMMNYFEHISCLTVLINHIILYINISNQNVLFNTSCLLEVNFQVLSHNSTNSILNLWVQDRSDDDASSIIFCSFWISE